MKTPGSTGPAGDRAINAAGFLLPWSVLLGHYAAFGSMTMFRALVLVLLVMAALGGRAWRGQWWFLGFGAAWLVLGVVSFLANPGASLGGIVNLAFGWVLAWTLARLRGRHFLTCIGRGWQWAIIMSAPLAFWEWRTARHLPDYGSGVWQHHPNSYFSPATFFVNPNYYALFLTVGLALGGWLTSCRIRTGPRRRTLAWDGVVLLCGAWLLWITHSRACVLALLVLVAAGIVQKLPVPVVAGIAGLGVLTAALVVWRLGANHWQMWMSVWRDHADLGPRSIPVRMSLLAFGITLLQGHQLLGAGPDGFARAAATQQTFSLHGKVNAHNGLIEVAVDYGLIVLVLLVAAWLSAVIIAWHAGRTHPRGTRAATVGVLMGLLVASPLLMFANSQFIGPNVTSAWMAVMMCLTALVLDDPDGPENDVRNGAQRQSSGPQRERGVRDLRIASQIGTGRRPHDDEQLHDTHLHSSGDGWRHELADKTDRGGQQ
ncbi:MAG: O-antigen ligase family protein [Cutibacterium granulosum]|uniref:O-antigen ligase family protein n=1 Tax=Cutibacterium granulosum TaxID=33011 RepID=UPI002B230EB1|nr:O-antigen ligase family protein [Cutibacterium granulosum]MEA5635761.1 O-antigen ligase family protein [Cutibacterium granulosum]